MGWMIFILATLGWHIGLYGMFKKAGIETWKALVPFYNTWIITEKTGISKLWFWLQLVPIAGQFITIWITIHFVMQFGRFSLTAHTLTVFVPFAYFPYLGFSSKARYGGREVVKLYKKSPSREWIDAAVFAVVAATLIRTFIFEAYTIPTGSMEKTLLINDFLFVNKMSYGPRIPQTPISFPFVHNTMPFSQTTPSYTKLLQLPYKRLPGFTSVQRNDVVVFNFPAGDTIINLPEYGSAVPYYDVLRAQYHGNRDALMADGYPILVHPMDKTDNYIKRCVAVSGDDLYLKNGQLFINNGPAYVPPYSPTDYRVDGPPLDRDYLRDELGMNVDEEENSLSQGIYNLTLADVEKVKKLPNVKGVHFQPMGSGAVFPYDQYHPWNVDNFGPIHIPKKGETVQLSPQNIELYRRIIDTYEHNTLEETNGHYRINGKPATSYTFQYNYYWMMGDNRHRSQDSRYWGFVPETHIVGKASLIWFSWSNGPRWNRLFKAIH